LAADSKKLLVLLLLLLLPVAVNFNTVDQAFANTATKTVAISAAILIYTVAAMVLLPLTATQQVHAHGS
jgi:ABC-type uncharacterized transport system permease subunit